MTTPSKLTPEQLLQSRSLEAMREATRFLVKIEEALAEMKSGASLYQHSKARAAAKRASLDLTRALAQFRRSPYE